MPGVTTERYRQARMASYLSQHEQAEERFRRDLIGFFQKQIRHVQQVVRQAGKKSPTAYRSYGQELGEFAFRPREWDELLVETAKPHIAMSLLLGAATESWLFRYVVVARVDPDFGEWAEQSFKSVQKNARHRRHHAAKVVGRLRQKAGEPGDMIPFPELQGGGSAHQFIDTVGTEHLGPAFYNMGLPPETMKEMKETLRSTFAREDWWKGINDTTKFQIERLVADGVTSELSPSRLASEIAGKLGGEEMLGRATNIVRTETTMAFNAGHNASMGSLAQAGLVEGKEWIAVIDDNTRPAHADANGQQVAYNQPFMLGGWECAYPGDEMLPAEDRCNCRCAVFSVYPDDMDAALARADAAIDAGQMQPGSDYMPDVFGPGAAQGVVSEATGAAAQASSVADDIARTVSDTLDDVAPAFVEPTAGPWASARRPRRETREAFDIDERIYSDDFYDRTRQHVFGEGSTIDPSDLSMMAGAPDGAGVSIVAAGDEFVIKVASKQYGVSADRIIRKGADGNPEIYNMYLQISKQGEGTGTRMLMRQVDAARKHGIKTLKCDAAGSIDNQAFNGYYTWAKLGYDGDIPHTQKWLIKEGDGPIGVPKSATKIHQLMQTKDGREWWKRNGTEWEATFSTHSKARSYQMLKEYHDVRFGLKPKPDPRVSAKPVYQAATTKKKAEEFCNTLPMVESADFSQITLKQANRINKKLTELQNTGALKRGASFKVSAFKAGAKDNVGGSFTMGRYSSGDGTLKLAGNFDDFIGREVKRQRRSLVKERKRWTLEYSKLADKIENEYLVGFDDLQIAQAEKQMGLIDDYLKGPSSRLSDVELATRAAAKQVTRASTLEDAIEHEFGHILEADLQTAYKQHALEVKGVLQEIKARSAYRQDNDGLFFTVDSDVFDIEAMTGMGIDVSQYACTNGKEYFAESYLMYRQGKELPDNLLTKLFKGLGL